MKLGVQDFEYHGDKKKTDANRRDGFLSIRAFGNDLNVGFVGEKAPQASTRDALIIGDDYGQRHAVSLASEGRHE